MNKLVKYLIDYAEDLIDMPIRPTVEVLQRDDAALYIWRKMGMTHSIMRQRDPMNGEGWRTLSPASHVYPLDQAELDSVKKALNRFYIELKQTFPDDIGSSLWYIVRSKDGDFKWDLYQDDNSLGDIDESSVAEYAETLEEALANFVYSMKNDIKDTLDVANCVVFPFGCSDSDVWQYTGMVTLLGEEETKFFKENVVNKFVSGEPTSKVEMIL